eukprot:2702806-Amphidinium_carterae.1
MKSKCQIDQLHSSASYLVSTRAKRNMWRMLACAEDHLRWCESAQHLSSVATQFRLSTTPRNVETSPKSTDWLAAASTCGVQTVVPLLLSLGIELTKQRVLHRRAHKTTTCFSPSRHGWVAGTSGLKRIGSASPGDSSTIPVILPSRGSVDNLVVCSPKTQSASWQHKQGANNSTSIAGYQGRSSRDAASTTRAIPGTMRLA